ncbi:TetR-like C-terminal domain-containing protein [Jeotgalibaca sp. A122]|uniref:TetR-like C-terminal domain-containing protein n=1 Tax=Jeotgalibaca sp. A122 TaxID=3457322 RepID=UPI003FCF0361
MHLKKQDLKLFDFIYENRRVFSLWKQSDLSQDLTMRCTQAIYQKLYGIWIEKNPDKERQAESASRIMSYQIMGIIYGWLINGLQTDPTIIADEFIQFYKDQANH